MDDQEWTKRGDEGFRDVFRVYRNEFDQLQTAFRSVQGQMGHVVGFGSASPNPKKALKVSGDQCLMVFLLRMGFT